MLKKRQQLIKSFQQFIYEAVCSAKEMPAVCCRKELMWHVIKNTDFEIKCPNTFHFLNANFIGPCITSLGSRRLGTNEENSVNSQGPKESCFTRKKSRRAEIRLDKVGKGYWQVMRRKVTTWVIF